MPAYNEEQTLPIVIQKIEKYFSCSQIIIANDGSTDRTREIAKKLRLRIIRNQHNHGKGHILRKSFNAILKWFPNAKWILTMDADDQHHQNDIPNFIEAIETNPNIDIVLGRRNYRQMPPFNLVSNTLTTRWCNYWLAWNLYDLQCGFRCYSTNGLLKIMNFGLSRNKFDFETEILLVAWFLDLEIIDIPIVTLYPTNRRKSRVIPSIDTFRWILLILQFGFSLKFLRKIWKMRHIRKQNKRNV